MYTETSSIDFTLFPKRDETSLWIPLTLGKFSKLFLRCSTSVAVLFCFLFYTFSHMQNAKYACIGLDEKLHFAFVHFKGKSTHNITTNGQNLFCIWEKKTSWVNWFFIFNNAILINNQTAERNMIHRHDRIIIYALYIYTLCIIIY